MLGNYDIIKSNIVLYVIALDKLSDGESITSVCDNLNINRVTLEKVIDIFNETIQDNFSWLKELCFAVYGDDTLYHSKHANIILAYLKTFLKHREYAILVDRLKYRKSFEEIATLFKLPSPNEAVSFYKSVILSIKTSGILDSIVKQQNMDSDISDVDISPQSENFDILDSTESEQSEDIDYNTLDIYSIKIADLDISYRCKNTLLRAGFVSVGDIYNFNKKRYLAYIRNFGKVSFYGLRESLKSVLKGNYKPLVFDKKMGG